MFSVSASKMTAKFSGSSASALDQKFHYRENSLSKAGVYCVYVRGRRLIVAGNNVSFPTCIFLFVE